MKIVKWINRLAVILLMITISQSNDVGIVMGFIWTIVGEFIYLFFIENWLLRVGDDKENSMWWIDATNVYMENQYNISYLKWMWIYFILMLQEDYDD